jgi:hypothetical protein
MIFIPGLLYRNNSKLGGWAELLGLYLLIWLTTSITSPVLLILLITKTIRKSFNFTLTLLASFNLYFGLYGAYMILSGQVYRPGPYALEISLLNLLWTTLIVLYIIRRSVESTGS